jgi:UDP-N-acetylglucosamine--N-acetylmuramyl-(pentapeptide) pyrophosphoryl-undecaprenol N-acetylglucosamine transferase
MLTGGGTGGHITPLIAVAEELKSIRPEAFIVCVGERGGKFAHLTAQIPCIDQNKTIFAGKFRRYHGESWIQKLMDVGTNLLNARDAILVCVGILQSIVLMRRVNPSVVFLKGGFVGVPIGLAAAFWRIPIVTHDSDALPGLANRIISRWAKIHATGMPAEFYKYPKDKVRHVGVLVGKNYKPVSDGQRIAFRRELGFPEKGRLLFITGGSLGSQRLNAAVQGWMQEILTLHPDLTVVHQVGKGNGELYGSFTHDRLHVLEFLDGMHRYSGAADLIVTRAGANTIAEFGVQGKACIVVPSPFLAGGHQLKNGDFLTKSHAALVIDEAKIVADPSILSEAVEGLLDNPIARVKLSAQLELLAVPDAANRLATLLLEVTNPE